MVKQVSNLTQDDSGHQMSHTLCKTAAAKYRSETVFHDAVLGVLCLPRPLVTSALILFILQRKLHSTPSKVQRVA